MGYWVNAQVKSSISKQCTYEPLNSIYECYKQLDLWVNKYNLDITYYEIKNAENNVLIIEGAYRPLKDIILQILKNSDIDIKIFKAGVLNGCSREQLNRICSFDLDILKFDVLSNWIKE